MLTGKDLISLGIKPGPKFSEILEKSKSFANKEEALEFAKTFIEPPKEKVTKKPFIVPNSVLEFLLQEGRNLVPPFLEGRAGEPSNSEIRRILENKAVVINGFTPGPTASIENQFPLWQLIWFPNAEKRITMIDGPRPHDANAWFDVEGNRISEGNKTFPSR